MPVLRVSVIIQMSDDGDELDAHPKVNQVLSGHSEDARVSNDD